MDLFTIYITLAVFGVGVTIIDFLGVLDQFGGSDDADGDGQIEAGTARAQGSNLITEKKQSKELAHREKPGIRAITKIMTAIRSVVYFSLGFGPTGLFAHFSGLSRASGLIWACAVGAAMMVLGRLLKRFVKKDLDSSIKSDELLQEKGILLLPLESGAISKASVRQFGREMEVYVRCMNKELKLPKGHEIIIVDYDGDVYWIEPVDPSATQP